MKSGFFQKISVKKPTMGEKQDAKGVSDSQKTGETIKEQETQIAKEQNTIEEDFPDGIAPDDSYFEETMETMETKAPEKDAMEEISKKEKKTGALKFQKSKKEKKVTKEKKERPAKKKKPAKEKLDGEAVLPKENKVTSLLKKVKIPG